VSQQINLYNPIFLKEEKYFSALTMVRALGIIAAGLALFWGYAAFQISRLDKIAGDLDRQLAEQRAALVRLATEYSPDGAVRRTNAEIVRLEVQVQSGDQLLNSVRTGELGNTAGFSGYFSALARQALPGVWLTGMVIGGSGSELTLQGRVVQAHLVPAYIQALGAEPLMQGRVVTELKLSARDESASATAPSAAGAPAATGPKRYVEFSMTALQKSGAVSDVKPASGGKS